MTEQEALEKFREVNRKIAQYNKKGNKSDLQLDYEYRDLPKLYKLHAGLHKLLHIQFGYSFQQLDNIEK